ncbi:MAG: pilin, partial [Pseudomonadales bacterium]
MVAIIGILAAIALPAYQDYTKRARISEGLSLAAGAKTAVAEYQASQNAFPSTNASAGLPVNITGGAVAAVAVGNRTAAPAIAASAGTITVGLPDNVTIAGNLTVSGTTTTIDTTNTTIADSLLELNSGATSNSNDSGIIIERGSTGDNAIIMWDESA